MDIQEREREKTLLFNAEEECSYDDDFCVKSIQKERRVKTRNFSFFFQNDRHFLPKISLRLFVLKRHKFCVTYTSSAHNLHAHKKDEEEEEEEDQGF